MGRLQELLYTILAQADSLRDSRMYLRSMATKLAEHLVKLLVWGDTQYCYTWVYEIIDKWLSPLLYLETKNKTGKLKEKDYITYLFNPNMETKAQFERFTRRIIRNCISEGYSIPSRTLDYDLFWDKYITFRTECLKLLTDNTTTEEDFKRILLELGE